MVEITSLRLVANLIALTYNKPLPLGSVAVIPAAPLLWGGEALGGPWGASAPGQVRGATVEWTRSNNTPSPYPVRVLPLQLEEPSASLEKLKVAKNCDFLDKWHLQGSGPPLGFVAKVSL